jgi:hypothetical protein
MRWNKRPSCMGCGIRDEMRGTVVTKLASRLSAAVKSKAAVAILATVVAVGAAGGGTVAAASNGAFGQQVKAKVESCKDALASGTHGIGECVSDFAQQHSQGNSASSSHNTHGNNGQHNGPPSGAAGASHGKAHGKP